MASLISQQDDSNTDYPQRSVDEVNDDFCIYHTPIQDNISNFTSVNFCRVDPCYNLKYDVFLDDISDIYYSEMNNYILLNCFGNNKNKNFSKKINNFFEKLESKIDKNQIFSELYKGTRKINNYKINKKKFYSNLKKHLKIKLKFEKNFEYTSQFVNLKMRCFKKPKMIYNLKEKYQMIKLITKI